MVMIVEQLMEAKSDKGTEVLGRNLSSRASLSTTDPTWLDMGSKLKDGFGKAAANRLSYGTAFHRPYATTFAKYPSSDPQFNPEFSLSMNIIPIT
jgi:hypothetical protein